MKFLNFKNHQGQGMIELIVSISVIVFAMVGIISLTIINIYGHKVSENSLIATQLAREGIDTVRNMRDTSWLKGDSYIRLATSNYADHNGIVKFSPPTTTPLAWKYDGNAVDDTGAGAGLNDTDTIVYFDSTLNAYFHYQGSQRTATPYRRLITIDAICQDTTTNLQASTKCTTVGDKGICEIGETCLTCCGNNNGDGIPDVMGIRVISTVQWPEKNSTKSYTLVDYLFDWK